MGWPVISETFSARNFIHIFSEIPMLYRALIFPAVPYHFGYATKRSRGMDKSVTCPLSWLILASIMESVRWDHSCHCHQIPAIRRFLVHLIFSCMSSPWGMMGVNRVPSLFMFHRDISPNALSAKVPMKSMLVTVRIPPMNQFRILWDFLFSSGEFETSSMIGVFCVFVTGVSLWVLNWDMPWL